MDWRLYFHVDGEDAFAYIEPMEGGAFRAEIIETGAEATGFFLQKGLDWIKTYYEELHP